jgi:putative transposase
VVSDDHEGIKAAVAGELPGTEWQRCAVHFQRNVLSHVPACSMSEVAEDLSAIFKVSVFILSYKARRHQNCGSAPC